MKEAKTYWYREIQKASFTEEWIQLQKKDGLPSKSPLRKLNPYFDEKDKLLRVGGRLQFSELPEEMKHQIILPAKHPSSRMDITWMDEGDTTSSKEVSGKIGVDRVQ